MNMVRKWKDAYSGQAAKRDMYNSRERDGPLEQLSMVVRSWVDEEHSLMMMKALVEKPA